MATLLLKKEGEDVPELAAAITPAVSEKKPVHLRLTTGRDSKL